jgi:hypothetical protein
MSPAQEQTRCLTVQLNVTSSSSTSPVPLNVTSSSCTSPAPAERHQPKYRKGSSERHLTRLDVSRLNIWLH